MAVPYDPDEAQIKGQAVPVLEGIYVQALNASNSQGNTGAGQYSISDSSVAGLRARGIIPESENSLVHVDHKGNFRTVVAFTSEFGAPRMSPDGRLVASESARGNIAL